MEKNGRIGKIELPEPPDFVNIRNTRDLVIALGQYLVGTNSVIIEELNLVRKRDVYFDTKLEEYEKQLEDLDKTVAKGKAVISAMVIFIGVVGTIFGILSAIKLI